MISSWEETKKNSIYHFDKNVIDARWDGAVGLGRFSGSWQEELDAARQAARPVNWETRGYKGENVPSPDIEAEEYDLAKVGADPKMIVGRFQWELAPIFQKMCDLFALEDPYNRLHVQFTGEVFNMHIDKLQKWDQENPHNVMRVIIHLNDWEPGQFYQYGNVCQTNWRAGDIVTFDHLNVPHGTANASYLPRATLQTTGKKTKQTLDFLSNLRQVYEYKI